VTGAATAARWLLPADVDPGARLRLFLFHHSGGSAAMYHDWLTLLPSDVAGQCVQLPGRHDRRDEPAYTRFEPLATAVADMLAAELDERPYALFGHSMGAVLAYRVAVGLRHHPPTLIALSGCAPEGFRFPLDNSATDDDLADVMVRLGSLPSDARHDPGLLSLTVPVMRADLTACASYVDDGSKILCPIVAYGGRDDPMIRPTALRSWATRTPAYLGTRVFPGGHFFLDRQATAITHDVTTLLRRHALS
jgi:surfactin synthase thioesterase subunit